MKTEALESQIRWDTEYQERGLVSNMSDLAYVTFYYSQPQGMASLVGMIRGPVEGMMVLL